MTLQMTPKKTDEEEEEKVIETAGPRPRYTKTIDAIAEKTNNTEMTIILNHRHRSLYYHRGRKQQGRAMV